MQEPDFMDDRRSSVSGTVGAIGGGRHSCIFHDVISVENIFGAWKEFCKGKRSKEDVVVFELSLEDNIFRLHEELSLGTWKPDPYIVFQVQDPKLRTIHKASVRDRVLYQAIYRSLYQVFDKSFIHDVYSSRDVKGTHAGVERLDKFVRKVSKNFTQPTYVLKCDIRKFFDSIDHSVLLHLIHNRIEDEKLFKLIGQIIDSFHHTTGKGLPLGNVTSQLFANVYMNEFDQFMKHTIKSEYYIRYCDDFVVVNESREFLETVIPRIIIFLRERLQLELHPRKMEIRKIEQGIDFLGYVTLPYYKVLRTSTKNRMLNKIEIAKHQLVLKQISWESFNQIVQSYVGVVSHCRNVSVIQKILYILLNK